MPKTIYSEGRVVGMSAYEIYTKQYLIEGGQPDEIASEKEWLASSIAMGASMLLKLPQITMNEGHEYDHMLVDIQLPANSKLSTANTIIASYFDGECDADSWEGASTSHIGDGTIVKSAYWSTNISSYGDLISSNLFGEKTPGSSIARKQDLADWSTERKAMLRNYMQVVDGVVIQPGVWNQDGTMASVPPKFDPTLMGNAAYPRIRLDIRGSIEHPPIILLTGFTIRSVLAGTTKEISDAPQDGDFIGPGVFPWANKIVFSVPTSFITYFAADEYIRKIWYTDDEKGDVDFITNTDSSTIDMRSGSGDRYTPYPVLENYYGKNYIPDTTYPNVPSFGPNWSVNNAKQKSVSRIPNFVKSFTTLGDGTAVLTVYQKSSLYPPALYGTAITVSNENNPLNPLDVTAPGTVKMFYNDNGTYMNDYQNTFPGTTAMNKNPDGSIETLDDDGNKVPIVNMEVIDEIDSGNGLAALVSAGEKSLMAVSLVADTDGTVLPVDGSGEGDPGDTGEYPVGTNRGDSATNIDFTHVSWRNLLYMLKHNKHIDFSDVLVAGKGIEVEPKDGKLVISAIDSSTIQNKLKSVYNDAYLDWINDSTTVRNVDYVAGDAYKSSSAYTVHPFNRFASYIQGYSDYDGVPYQYVPVGAKPRDDDNRYKPWVYCSGDGSAFSHGYFGGTRKSHRLILSVSAYKSPTVTTINNVEYPDYIYIQISGSALQNSSIQGRKGLRIGTDSMDTSLFGASQDDYGGTQGYDPTLTSNPSDINYGLKSRLWGISFSGPLEVLQHKKNSGAWRYTFSDLTGQLAVRQNLWNIGIRPNVDREWETILPGGQQRYKSTTLTGLQWSTPTTTVGAPTDFSNTEMANGYNLIGSNGPDGWDCGKSRIICHLNNFNNGYNAHTLGGVYTSNNTVNILNSSDCTKVFDFSMNHVVYGVFVLSPGN